MIFGNLAKSDGEDLARFPNYFIQTAHDTFNFLSFALARESDRRDG